MTDATTFSGETIPCAVIDQLLATADCTTGVRPLANTTLTKEAGYKYGLAYRLSGGRDLLDDAHSAGIDNLLGHAAPAVVAFALHHSVHCCPTGRASSGSGSMPPPSPCTPGSART